MTLKSQIVALNEIDDYLKNAQGSASGGVAGLASNLMGAIYNSVLPTLLDGQQSSLQLDANGRLIIGTSANSAINVAHCTANYGTYFDDTYVPLSMNTYGELRTSVSLDFITTHVSTGLGVAVDNETLRVAIASDSTIGIQANANASTVENDALTTAPVTEVKPANAVGFKIQALSSNSANIRLAIGSAASSTFGLRLEPGRSEDFDIGADVSLAAETGTQAYVIIWKVK